RIGQALGYQLEELEHMPPETLARAGEGDAAALAEITRMRLEAAKTRSAENRPSLAQDIAKGRRTEIDYINGYVVEMGERIGLAAPTNKKMIGLVKRLEKGEIAPGVEHLEACK